MAQKKTPVEPLTAKPQNARSPLYYLHYLLIILPCVIYFSAVNTYNVNIPYQDDYDGVLKFLTAFENAPNFMSKFLLLFSQHGEHRIFSSRIEYVIDNAIFGKVNFIHLIFVANLQLLIFYLLLVHHIKKMIPVYWSIVSVIVGFCIFDLSSYENANFALSGTVNYGILMLFLASIHFYNKVKSRDLVIGAILQVICTFSSGAGILVSLCIVIFNWLNGSRHKIITSTILLLLFAPLYFIGYEKTLPTGYVDKGFDALFILKFFLRLAGGHFGNDNSLAAAIMLFGLTIWVLPIKFKRKVLPTINKEALPVVCLFGYVFATFCMISVFRSNSVMGELGAYQSRYLINSHLFVAIVVVLSSFKFLKSKFFFYSLSIAAIICGIAYKSNYQYGEACLNMTKSRLEYYPYYYGGHKEKDNEIARQIETEACKLGIYCISDER